MADFSDIMVRVGADVEPLKKGFQTAGEKVKKFKGSALGAAKAIAGVTAAAAGSAAALVVMANAAAEDAKELANLSGVAGTSVDEFQRLAFASKTVGVEQDKLADIFKDTRDKVGDFLQTGGGPLADFFENIAPKVGVTADEFRNLSGPQALQKYASALQQANVSQNEMTFYLEAIASDAALLEPLLRNNGDAFEQLAEKAEKIGAVTSALDLAKLEHMKSSLNQIQSASEATTKQFAVSFAPVIGALADRFMEVRGETSLMQEAIDKTFGFTVKAVGFAADAIRGLHVVLKGLEAGFHGLRVVSLTVVQAIVDTFDYAINTVKNNINSLIDGMNKLPGVNIDKLVIGQSEAAKKLQVFKENAVAAMQDTAAEMHNLAMKPLPSTIWEEFVADAVQASNDAAAAIVSTRQKALEIPISNDPKDDPLVKYAEKTTEEMTAIFGRAGLQRAQFEADSNKKMADSQKAFGAQSVAAYSAMAGNISSLMQSENKKQFEIGKKAAAAQAIIDTIASAQAAFKSLAGIPVVGPALGAAAAGAATIAGMARLSQINSTQFGSKSAPSSVGGGSTQGAAASGQGAQSQGGNRTLFVENIDPSSLMTGATVRALASELLEFQRDGGEVVLT